MVMAMSGTNATSGWGTRTVVFSTPDTHGRALVVGGDVLGDDPWLLVLVFRAGDRETNLVAHLVAPIPDWWAESIDERSAWLLRIGSTLVSEGHGRQRLTTAVVRSATTTGLERDVRRLAAQTAEDAWQGAVRPGQREKVSGPRSAGDLRRARVARRYVELVATSSTPKVDLSAEMNLSPNTVNTYLHQARERGLLTSVGRGKLGGVLTPLAHEILERGN